MSGAGESGLGERGLKLANDGDVRFVPGNWINTYRHWMENLQDWCISRQLWWGHRIPAWFDASGNVYVGRDEDEARAKHSLGADVTLTQDSDVLETWFSSGLWPFSTLGWPDADAMAERGFKRYLPSSVRGVPRGWGSPLHSCDDLPRAGHAEADTDRSGGLRDPQPRAGRAREDRGVHRRARVP
jgi:hypothetical protein